MPTNSLLSVAESWEKIYQAFEDVNFTAYDRDAIKQSLLTYLKLTYPENFNDYIESSMIIALVDVFAYVTELLAYRIDISVHENLMATATRKQSILRLAKLISYTASRNLPLRGLVKINSISISENTKDSQGNSLSNRIISWNDQNNPLWREQFFIAINKIMTQSYGFPFKSFQVDDTVFQQYEIQNIIDSGTNNSFINGVLKLKAPLNGQDLNFELVPADIDEGGPFERDPDSNAFFNLVYADDGYGDSSPMTGFMLYLKQGTLQKLTYVFDINLPNRNLDINVININDSDVWVQRVDTTGVVLDTWEQVPNVAGTNLMFNTIQNKKKYEIETLENDQVRLIFGDGDFAEIPLGIFNVWVRQSVSGGMTMPQNLITDQTATFTYLSKLGIQESCTLSYSLVSALQNSALTEDIEHIKSIAPSVYYTQDRMVNGQDYNSYLLQDQSILRLRAVNRTFAGQPKYLNWNDASGAYQNVKVFGNDLRFYYNIDTLATVSMISSRSLIDDVIEPLLATPSIYNLLIYALYNQPFVATLTTLTGVQSVTIHPFIRPRMKLVEDVNQLVDFLLLTRLEIDRIIERSEARIDPFKEKTMIQGVLDRHWYGEPTARVQLDVNLSDVSSLPKSVYGVVNDDSDGRIYDSNLKGVYQNQDTGVYTAILAPGGVSGIQESSIKQKRFGIAFKPYRPFLSNLLIKPHGTTVFDLGNLLGSTAVNQTSASEGETITIEIINTAGAFSVYSSVSGYHIPGNVGEDYNNGVISFVIGPLTAPVVIGDSFVIFIYRATNNLLTPHLIVTNLSGKFILVDESELPIDAIYQAYDVNDYRRSWIMIIERTDSIDNNVLYWTITYRNFELIAESLTTKFWYNQDEKIIDAETKKPVLDVIRLLKSNLNAAHTAGVGNDIIYNVDAVVRYPNGEINYGAVVITPASILAAIDTAVIGGSVSKDALEFLEFIGSTDYVYFKFEDPIYRPRLVPVATTPFLRNLTYTNNVSGVYVRKPGREALDFMWQHFTPHNHLIDPSPSNIIDIYALTRGYYSQMINFVNGISGIEPVPPSSLELRTSYRVLLESKMISDTVVMHSGKVKLIFGELAVPELRAKFRVLLAPNARLTGDQVRSRVLQIIKDYFKIDNWDFGQSFYATELCSVIHKQLATIINSVVLVPIYPTSSFGDLFYLRSAPDEIFMSCASLNNIEIISSIDRLSLKQKL